MAIDFPSSPAINQQFTGGSTTYQWDGIGWNIVPQVGPIFIGDTPPANPAIGQQWWRSTNGQLYLWYDDGNTKQWVQAAGGAGVPSIWEPIYNGLFTGNPSFAVPNLGAYELLRGYLTIRPPADGGGIYMQVSVDNGNNWVSTASYITEYHNVKGTTLTGLYNTGAQVALPGSFAVSTPGMTFGFDVFQWNKPTVQGRLQGRWGGDDGVLHEGSLYSYLPLGTRNAMRFYSSTGSGIVTGYLVLEGVRG